MINIIEIIRPANDGKSLPHICRGDDDNIYYVKGIGATRDSQISEWICHHLANAFGLPIPHFEIVYLAPELMDETLPTYKSHLGYGPAFGSQQVMQVKDFTLSGVKKVDKDIQLDIFIFDWWIKNLDRTFFNTNLLINGITQDLTVIDFNNVFESPFDKDQKDQFLDQHIFKDIGIDIFHDLELQSRYYNKLKESLKILPKAIDTIPNEWNWMDLEKTLPDDFDYGYLKDTLNTCLTDTLWRRT